jgi:hypothetical protein
MELILNGTGPAIGVRAIDEGAKTPSLFFDTATLPLGRLPCAEQCESRVSARTVKIRRSERSEKTDMPAAREANLSLWQHGILD